MLTQDDIQLWLGGGNSYLKAEKMGEWLESHPEEAAKYADKYGDEDELLDELVDAIYQTQDNVAVLTISGPMTNQDSIWNLFFGMVSYNTVSAALNRALEDESITDIVLNLSTTGGDAEGIGSVAENIRIADKQKPVYAFSGTKALSAGYWMAASTRQIYGTPMSEWGSIGVIVTHVSRHRMLKERGFDVTVFRGGKLKALGHPAEKLSDKAKKYFQEKAEKLYDFFLREISGERPSLKIEDKETWAEGRVFFAEDAQQVGLIDSVTTFNDLISSLVRVEDENGGVAGAPGTVGLNDGETTMKKIVLDPSALAQLASGVPLDQLKHKIEDASDASASGTSDGSNGSQASADGSGDGEPQSSADADNGADGQEPASNGSGSASDSSVVSFLREELANARQELASVTAENIRLKGENDRLDSDVKSLREVAVDAIERLHVYLGQTPVDMSSLSSEALSAQYSSANRAFHERFKVGRVSASAEEVDTSDVRAAARKIGLVPKAQ